MSNRYLECIIAHNDGSTSKGFINTNYIIYAERFDENLVLFHLRNGEGIFVNCNYEHLLSQMKRGWNNSYEFTYVSDEGD